MDRVESVTLPTAQDADEPVNTVSEALDEQVYRWVRERIVDGTFKPGERIRERVLAEEMGVSRVPIREAFPRLESEGYIKSLHRRGVIVAPVTLQDVADLFTVRSSLEVLTARLAAQRCADGADGRQLRASLAEAEHAVAADDQPRIAEATFQLHDDLLTLAGNRLLSDLMTPIRGRVRRLSNVVVDRNNTLVHHEHEALCVAVLAGEVELSAALAFAHVEHSRIQSMPIVATLLKQAD